MERVHADKLGCYRGRTFVAYAIMLGIQIDSTVEQGTSAGHSGGTKGVT